MLYCTKCKVIMKDGPCPVCGRSASKLKAAEDHDAVLLISCRFQHATILEPFLNDSGIPCYRDGALGAALSMTFGSYFELYHLYVPYASYREAFDLVLNMFADDQEIISRLHKYETEEPDA